MTTGVDAKLLRSTRFPPIFNQKVDMQKVNLQVMKKWIQGKIANILGNDDDVVIELCCNLLENARNPDIKGLQIQLTGFLEKETPTFCKELWELLLSAQTSPQGIPRELLEAKKLELIQEKIEAEKAAEKSRRNRDDSQRFNRDFLPRGGERGDRSDSWRGGLGSGRRGSDIRRGGSGSGGRWRRDRSRSPHRGRDLQDRNGYRTRHDLYVPSDRRSRGERPQGPRRRNSLDGDNSRSRSRSRSRSHSPNADSSSSRTRSRSRSSHRSYTRSRSPPRPGQPHTERNNHPNRSGKRQRSQNPRAGRGRRRDASRGRSHSPAPKRRRGSQTPNSRHSRRQRSVSSISTTSSLSSSRGGSRRSPSPNHATTTHRRQRDYRRSRTRSHSRMRSVSSETQERGGRGRRRERQHRTPSSHSSHSSHHNTHSSRQNVKDGRRRNSPKIGDNHGRRGRSRSPGRNRRMESSSVSSRSRSRVKLADGSGKDRPRSEAKEASAAGTMPLNNAKLDISMPTETKQLAEERLNNEQRERQLKEKIMQMRSSINGPSNVSEKTNMSEAP